MKKKTYLRIEFLVVLLAVIIAVNSQFLGFFNKYRIVDDTRQHLYWMRQFHDKDLFKNDLLTECSKSYQPWGIVFLYYALSFIADPMVVSKFLPIILFAVSSLYVFKLTKYATTTYIGFLTALVFMATPFYLGKMTGGLSRGFGFLLLIVFLYCLIKKDYQKSSLIMALQCLFYPTIFFLSIITYLFTFINFKHWGIFVDKSVLKNKPFIFSMFIGIIILLAEWLFFRSQFLNSVVTRQQIIGNPEFYSEGRYQIMPTPHLLPVIFKNMAIGIFISKPLFWEIIIIFILILFLTPEKFMRKIFFPSELVFLFLSGVLMYIVSDLVLMKLYLPIRYIECSVPLVTSIMLGIGIGQLVERIKYTGSRKIFKIVIIVLIALNVNIKNRSFCLMDASKNKGLYEYLSSLPEDAMIAATPSLADNIPTFSQRKVFINYELSQPIFDKYWKIIKKRTYNFFDAYYSKDLLHVYKFCERNQIDYLVIDKTHFTKQYLMRRWLYFEPFNSYIKEIVKNRSHFALDNIPDKDKLYIEDSIFVIKKDTLKN